EQLSNEEIEEIIEATLTQSEEEVLQKLTAATNDALVPEVELETDTEIEEKGSKTDSAEQKAPEQEAELAVNERTEEAEQETELPEKSEHVQQKETKPESEKTEAVKEEKTEAVKEEKAKPQVMMMQTSSKTAETVQYHIVKSGDTLNK